MRIDIERVHALKEELDAFNRMDIKDVELFRDGEKIDIPQQAIDQWNLFALNNVDFVEMELWKQEQNVRE